MRDITVAVLGATGAVGREMLKVLCERGLPPENIIPLAGARSAGSVIECGGARLAVRETNEDAFRGADFVLGAAEAEVSRRFAPHIAAAGAVYIDNSSAFRLREDVPLVVPEINGADARSHRGIIANPNCSTIITMLALAPIARISPIEEIYAATYQAVSGAGEGGIRELREQLSAASEGRETPPRVFPAPIAMNVIPFIGAQTDNGFTDEEMKMQNEGRRILHAPGLRVCCTCVRVPVLRSHSIAVTVRTRGIVTVEQAERALRGAPGCRLADGERPWPTPLDVVGDDVVTVGRIRRDPCCERGLALWCCGDQLRRGAAGNAVGILQMLCA